jgi:hypothetical protein
MSVLILKDRRGGQQLTGAIPIWALTFARNIGGYLFDLLGLQPVSEI